MSEIKLRECPFCEGEATSIERYNYSAAPYSAVPLHLVECWVECCECGARTDTFLTEAEAVEAWNRRVSDSEVAE